MLDVECFLIMPGQAQITSIDALESFRSDLIVYLSQMRPVLDEAGGEVVRMKFWLQNDRRQFWENQARQRRRRLEEAQAELFNARLSTLQDSSLLQHMAVQRTQRAVQEAEEKLTTLKKWGRDLENLAEPLVKQIDQLQGFLAGDMAKAVAYLTQVMQALQAYTEELPASPTTSSPSSPSGDAEKP
jgi:hypothetical protein